VLILSDDYGWGSVGCYGAKRRKTPNMDRLAREGRRFTHAYAPGSVCSPTRYGLMTGATTGAPRSKMEKFCRPTRRCNIENLIALTLASLCKSQGYTTAAFGKWHLA